MRRSANCSQLILDAAERLVVDQGAPSLTLDAVAARAGVSKGGLLYHYRTKEALLRAMVERSCTAFEVRTRERRAEDGGAAGALPAYVSVALERRANRSLAGALIAAIANDTRLLEPTRAHFRRWLRQLEPHAPSFADRAILWLATEGLWLLELLELSPMKQDHRAAIAARLAELAQTGSLGLGAPKRGRLRGTATLTR